MDIQEKNLSEIVTQIWLSSNSEGVQILHKLIKEVADSQRKIYESSPTPKQESAVSSAVKKVCGTHCDWPNCTLPECVVNKSPKQEDEYKIALQWYKQGIEDAGESIGDGIDADFYDQYGEQFKLK